jgi:transcriptional regulator GlxA family with amidase domain
MTSVFTGALVYAAAGLLDGRPATTHWASVELLASLSKDIEVWPDARFVDDGDLITGAGVSAGIDMALHLVARLHSADRARELRRVIQYDPEPRCSRVELWEPSEESQRRWSTSADAGFWCCRAPKREEVR